MTREALERALSEVKSHSRRDRPLSVRLSLQEHKRLQAAAKGQGIAAAALARILIITGLDDLRG
jgi:predicted DNA-binding protein